MSSQTVFTTAQSGSSRSLPFSQMTESCHSSPAPEIPVLAPLDPQASLSLCAAQFQGLIVELTLQILSFSLLSGLKLQSQNTTASCDL